MQNFCLGHSDCAVHVFKEKICMAKAQLEMKPASTVGDKKFLLNVAKGGPEKTGPLLDEDGHFTET